LKFYFIIILSFLFNQERINFSSANPFTFKDIIISLESQESQDVYGILRLPAGNNTLEKYPLIIGVAGSLGWSDHHKEYMDMYRRIGIATFELKSFSSRGVTSTVGSQLDVTMAMMVLDSYRALDILSQHSKIDISKVAITGWSLGGGVSLFTAWKKIIDSINPNNKFIAHLPIYPPCFIQPDNIEFGDSPIHILIGELDDWTPASACENLVDKISKNKKNIDITVYSNSHHSFDSGKSLKVIPNAYSFKDCMFDMNDEGSVLMNYLNIPMNNSFLQKIGLSFCISRGATVGGNKLAKEKSLNFSKEFMSRHLLNK